MKKTIYVAGLLLFFCLPTAGFADCTELGHFDTCVVQHDGSIIFYRGNYPLGRVELQHCTPDSSSNIRLSRSFVCEGDEILVDGERCKIMTVKVHQ